MTHINLFGGITLPTTEIVFKNQLLLERGWKRTGWEMATFFSTEFCNQGMHWLHFK